jgi:hypothetical protein
MPIYRLSDGREANVGPENESRFLEDFADFNPEVIEEDVATDVDVDEVTVEDEKKGPAIAPMGAGVVAPDDTASSLEEVSLDLPEDRDRFSKSLQQETIPVDDKTTSSFVESNQEQAQVDSVYAPAPEKLDLTEQSAYAAWQTSELSKPKEEFKQTSKEWLTDKINEGIDFAVESLYDMPIAVDVGAIIFGDYSTLKDPITVRETLLDINSWIGDFWQAANNGWDQGASVGEALDLYAGEDGVSEASPEEIKRYVDLIKQHETNVIPASVIKHKQIADAEDNPIFGFIKATLLEPEAMTHLLGQSGAMMFSGLLDDSRVQRNVGISTGVGTAGGPVGAMALGMGALSGTLETALGFGELLREETEKMEGGFNYENVYEILNDPIKYREIKRKATIKGLVIGGVDAMTGGITGKVVTRTASKGFKTRAAVQGTAIEGFGGGFGEGAGQLASGQDLNVYEIGSEIGPSMVRGAPNVTIGLLSTSQIKVNGQTVYDVTDFEYLIDNTPIDELQNLKFEFKNVPKEYQNRINKKLQRKLIKSQIDPRVTDQKDIEDIVDLELRLGKIKNSELESNKVEAAKIKEKIKAIYDKYDVDENNRELSDIGKRVRDNYVAKNIQIAEQFGLELNKDVLVAGTDAEYLGLRQMLVDEGATTDQAGNIPMKVDDTDPGQIVYLDGKGIAIINLEKSFELEAFTVGTHEVLHLILDDLLANMDKDQINNLVNDFRNNLDASESRLLTSEVESRYGTDFNSQEWFTVFMDLVGQRKIKQQGRGFWKDIANKYFTGTFKKNGFINAEFKTGAQAYELLMRYQQAIDDGTIEGKGIKDVISKATKTTRVKVKQDDTEKKFRSDGRSKDKIEEDVNDLVFGLDQETYFEEFDNIYSTIVQRGDFDNLISANDNISRNQKQKEEFIKEVLANMTGYIRNFDPTTNDNFFAYINSQIKNRSALIANRRLKEIETDQQSISLDDEGAFIRDIADEPTTTTTVEADEAPSLLDKLPVNANIRFTLKNSVRDALIKIGVNFSEGKKITRTVSPFISLFKKQIGDAPGGKKGISNFAAEIRNDIKKDYEGYLTTNMNRILKNAPLDWLANNFPSLVEKQVDGVFTADWKGKKIDRERSAKTGNTAGPQIIRRRKGISVELDAFLEHYLNPRNAKGKRTPKQMRVESLVKMLAQEFGLEYLSAELNKSNSELSKQVDQLANLRDVVLAENFAAELKRDLERGNVKKYRAAGKDFGQILLYAPEITQSAIKNGYRSPKFDDELRNLGIDPDSPTIQRFMDWLNWFGDEQAFKNPIREVYIGGKYPIFNSQLKKYFDHTISSDVAKNQLASFNGKLLKRYPSELLKVMKSRNDNFDLKSSSRLLNGSENGRVQDFKLKQDIEKRTQGNFGNVDELNFDITKIRLVNAGKGIAKRIEKFLEQDFNSREEKIKAFNEKFKQEIEDLNANNHGFIEFNVIEMIDLVVQNPDNLVGVLRHLEASSGNTSGFLRAYSRISLVEIFAKNQKADKNHPLYSEAIKFVKKYNPELDTEAQEARAISLLRQKGEHVMASSNLARGIAELIMESAGLILENPSEKQNILNNAKADLADLMYNYDQVLGSEVMFSTIDKRPRGTTDPSEYVRFDDVKDNLPNYYNPTTGQDGVQTQRQRIDFKVDLALAEIKDRVEYQKKFRAAKDSSDGGATIFDFDDTVATSNSQVIVIKKDGTQYTITPAEFAKKGERLLFEGNEFDFSQFNDVIDGKPGPFFEKLKKRVQKFGNENVYILTARPKESQLAIFYWLKSNGIHLKLENITGLGNSTALAKAQFVVDLVQEKGFTNVHFADDAVNNVETMDILLSQIEGLQSTSTLVVESKKYRSTKANQILETTTGIKEEMTFSEVVGRQRGKEKDKFKFLPYSAEDFKGLIYQLCGKGKQGELDFAFFKRELLDPFAKGINLINAEKQAIMNDYRALRKAMPEVRKKLGKKVPNTEFTFGMAIRVYLSDKAGYDIPGISKRDLNKIKSIVKNDPELLKFANTLGLISRKEEGYIELKQDWLGGSISSDLSDISVKINRKEFLKDFISAKNEIFTDEFKNKLRAAYGNKYVEALDDLLYRMETGARRNFGNNRIVNAWTNWVNNSVGAIMFFNARSAVLQTLSTVNFINWSDNNLFKAATAFANQPQYWKDFAFLFNSDFLKQRRAGLQTDVNQAELASAAMAAPNKAKSVLAYLLKKGFLPTQIADSFAIASGGATFYRNKIKKYVKEGMSQAEAEKQAFIDFQEIAEETQQSSRPDKISPQQASALGRWILAFQNTPMQYTRLIYRAGQDLANNRGSKVENISKIIYYGAMQNLIFASLQSALFAFAFDDEIDEDEQMRLEQKQIRIVNNMVDSILRGTGITGAAIATIKNTIMEFYKQEQKKFNNDHAQTLIQFANLAPPVGIKFRKVYSGIQSYTYNKDIVGEMSYLDPQNPGVQAVANVISGATNFPTDRIVNKTNNLVEVLNSDNENWQRLALTLGWNTWDVGVEQTRRDDAKLEVKQKKKEEKKKNQQRCTQIKSDGERCKMMVDKPKKKCHYHD